KGTYTHPNPPPLTVIVEPPKEDDDHNGNAVINSASIVPLFPLTRVRKIMKLDRDIIKVNHDVLHTADITTVSFLELMAEAALRVAMEKKHKTIKLEHIVTAISRQRRLADFLKDSIMDIGKEDTTHNDEDEEEILLKPSKNLSRTLLPPP
ncbi:hypothetical protein KI387_005009, partial [Taxus chinensis]